MNRILMSENTAPVVTDQGIFGNLPIPPNTDVKKFKKRKFNLRSVLFWISSTILTISLMLWITLTSALHLTSPKVALAMQTELIRTVIEVDQLIDGNINEITSNELNVLYPLPNTAVSKSEFEQLDSDQLRKILLERSAFELYTNGVSAFSENNRTIETKFFSGAGGVKLFIDLFTYKQHQNLSNYESNLVMLVCASTFLILLLGRGTKKFWSLGISALIASLLVLIATLAIKYLLAALLSNQLALTNDIQEIVNILFKAPVQNTITLGLAGMILLTLSFLAEQTLRKIPSKEIHEAQVIDRPDNKN